MEKYLHSKWTSVEKLNGWKHFEVKNVFVKNKELEIFSICDKEVMEKVEIKDIENRMKWIPGWE
tara:strand:+ start:681 stop:872 length:192 start_codon:yes stop_codon:yes gene_type:complete